MTSQQVESRYGPVVAVVSSSSEPDKVYEVRSDGASWSCQCPGYRFRRTCRHIEAARTMEPPCGHKSTALRMPVREPELLQRRPIRRIILQEE